MPEVFRAAPTRSRGLSYKEMRALDETSGPWVGWSVQLPRKIHERMVLHVGGGKISGTGEDADGDFVVEVDYESSGEVALGRHYTYCTSGPEGIGQLSVYRGRWDGGAISGEWHFISENDGGPFEMWPEDASGELNIEEARQGEPAGR